MKTIKIAVLLGLLVGGHLRLIELGQRQEYCDKLRMAQIDAIIELKKQVSDLELEELALRETLSTLRR